MKAIAASTPATRVCHRGFALVVTLSLMILLTVLAVGLLSLSAITLRTVEREAAAAVARANARVALMIALGELQTQLGPDRRIAQFAHPDVVGSAATAGRSRYLSVHDMNKKDGGVSPPWNRRATESFRTWLVSGDSAEVTNPSFPGAATPMHTVRLTSSNVPEKDSVSVPVTRIGQATGDFAWWIDDLGQKASLITAKAADESLRHVNPDRFLLSHALTDGSLSWFPDAPEHPARDRLVSRETAGILAPDRAQVSTLERWLGGTHFGLLADPHNGGLKKDLSAAFGSDLRTLVDALGERIFQSVDGAPTVDDPGGPKWAQLRSFYELAASSGALPVRPQTDEQMGIYPVIAGFVEMFGVSNTVGYSPAADRYLGTDGWYNYQGGTTPNYVMTVHMAPVLKLWNPYNRPLETAAYTIVVGNSDAQYVDGVQADETTFFWADTRPSNLPAGMRFEHRYHIPSVSFAPGEVKLFSLHENTFLDMFGGTYIPQTGLALGKKTDVVNAGFILGELGESPFTGHSFWDMHCTWPGLKAANAANLKYGHGRACENGYVYSPGRASDDGGDVTINDSRSKDTKAYRINVGKLVTWSLRLYKGRVAKGGYERPLVSIKNINTADIAPANTIKNHPNIPELDNPVSDPYFAGNRNLDATWARRISLRFLQNEGDHDPALYNGDGAQRPIKDIKWLADFNPRSPTIGCWPAEFSKRPDAFDPFAPVYPGGPLLINGAAGGSTLGYGLATPGNYLSGILMNPTNKAALEMNKFIGYSDDEGVSRCVLFEIPDFASREQIYHSVGQLRHANLTIENGDLATQLSKRFGVEDWFSDNLQAAYPIGSSRPDPRLMLGEKAGLRRRLTVTDGTGAYTATHYDLSWYLNDRLWDRVFFSARENTGLSYNSRLVLRPGRELKQGREGIDGNASALFVEGNFNVHCRSVEAWRSFLMANFGAKVTGEAAEDKRIPFSRFVRPAAGMITDKSLPSDPEAYLGYRSLTEAEAAKLALLIVGEIDRRGPFFSLAEFVNRSAVADAPREFLLSGLLQAAIDKSDINQAIAARPAGAIAAPSVSQIYEPAAYAGDIAAGVPGYLEQGDLLARVGHLLTVRSDTFVIRAYGTATRADGTVTARAWCEATVQRLPEYVDPGDVPGTALPDLKSPVNTTFGRRFIITSFRWLSAGEMTS